MKSIKTSLIFGACAAWLWLAVPDGHAQPTNLGGDTMNATLVEDQPEQRTLERKTLWELVRNGGLMMWPLAFLALYGFFKVGVQIYVIILSNNRDRDQALLMHLNPHSMSVDELQGEVATHKGQRQQAAFPAMCKVGLSRIYQGREEMGEALVAEGNMQVSRLRRGLKPLQTVITVAPLLGLMGTVYGMIASFQSLGAAGDKVEILSKGIYEALVTTAAGLTIAIPFLFVTQWLSHRIEQITENLNRQSEALLEKFHPMGGGIAEQGEVQLEEESPNPETVVK